MSGRPTCPQCRAEDVLRAVTWTAHSDEPCDRVNVVTLEEWQCQGCGLAFWMPVAAQGAL